MFYFIKFFQVFRTNSNCATINRRDKQAVPTTHTHKDGKGHSFKSHVTYLHTHIKKKAFAHFTFHWSVQEVFYTNF